jgi:hypothetical protein
LVADSPRVPGDLKLFLFDWHHIYDFMLTVKFKYDSSKVKINQIVITYFWNLHLESESTDNSLTNVFFFIFSFKIKITT